MIFKSSIIYNIVAEMIYHRSPTVDEEAQSNIHKHNYLCTRTFPFLFFLFLRNFSSLIHPVTIFSPRPLFLRSFSFSHNAPSPHTQLFHTSPRDTLALISQLLSCQLPLHSRRGLLVERGKRQFFSDYSDTPARVIVLGI